MEPVLTAMRRVGSMLVKPCRAEPLGLEYAQDVLARCEDSLFIHFPSHSPGIELFLARA